MNDLQCTISDVRCTILKYSILILFFISYSSAKAQTSIDSADILRRTAFQDSIFNHLTKVQPYSSSKTKKENSSLSTIKSTNKDSALHQIDTSKFASENIKEDSLTISTVNKKVKKQKKIDTAHYSPKKAAIWAAACPGLGQIYMKKYWKLPIVYGLLGATIYFVASNGKKLKEFNGYIRNVYDSVPNPEPYTNVDLAQIESFRNTYRRNVQLASFGTLMAWGLSIVDAVVDAHLHSFDISDKLTMKIKPELNYSNFSYYTGIGVNLNFK